MKRIITIVPILILLFSCASNKTDLERQLDRERNYERWIICRKAYSNAGAIWYSNYHAERGKRPRNHEIKDDLALNECRRILGKHWD